MKEPDATFAYGVNSALSLTDHDSVEGCAAAAVAHRLGLCDASVTVHMPGGPLGIEIRPDFTVRMTGPVVKVVEGELAQEALLGVI